MSWQTIQDEILSGENIWGTLGVGLFFSGLVFFLGWLVFHKKEIHKPDSIRVRAREGGKPSEAVLGNDFLFGMEMARRQSVRRKGNQIDILISPDKKHEKCNPGRILDRSMGGLCLLVTESAKIGQTLHVRTADAPDHIPWVEVKVKRCREADGGGWELGCQYVTQPAGEVLDLFG